MQDQGDQPLIDTEDKVEIETAYEAYDFDKQSLKFHGRRFKSINFSDNHVPFQLNDDRYKYNIGHFLDWNSLPKIHTNIEPTHVQKDN